MPVTPPQIKFCPIENTGGWQEPAGPVTGFAAFRCLSRSGDREPIRRDSILPGFAGILKVVNPMEAMGNIYAKRLKRARM
jgi:hypothetical protein